MVHHNKVSAHYLWEGASRFEGGAGVLPNLYLRFKGVLILPHHELFFHVEKESKDFNNEQS